MRIFDVRIDEQTVHFRMNILHCDLKPVEKSRFRNLNFLAESFN